MVNLTFLDAFCRSWWTQLLLSSFVVFHFYSTGSNQHLVCCQFPEHLCHQGYLVSVLTDFSPYSAEDLEKDCCENVSKIIWLKSLFYCFSSGFIASCTTVGINSLVYCWKRITLSEKHLSPRQIQSTDPKHNKKWLNVLFLFLCLIPTPYFMYNSNQE